MGPQSFGEWVTLGSLLVAVMALVGTQARTARSEHERDQGVRDKLDSIEKTGERTYAQVERITQKLDDHGVRIARIEERVDTLFRRVERIEDESEDRRHIGGSE